MTSWKTPSASLRGAWRLVLPLGLMALLAACSGMQRTTGSLPDEAILNALPVIQLGEAKPAQGDYIVFIPAGQPVRTTVEAKGSLFATTDSKQLEVTLQRNVYLYKNWLSFDKREWRKDDSAVGGRIHFEFPSYDRPQPGYVSIEFYLKP
jgi:hypothetical protein